MASVPNSKGYFGLYGGQYVPETLMVAHRELIEAYEKFRKDPMFKKELNYYLTNYDGRPTPLTFAANLTKKAKGAKIYLKREDLNHTGAHKINNCLGQILLAKRMERNASSLRRARASMEWPPPRCALYSACNVKSIWEKKMCNASPSTCFA